MSPFELRDLSEMLEFLQAEALQRLVWGDDDSADPADLMMVIQHEGGLVAGAFEKDELIGYIFGFPTRDRFVQHSHRLAVSPTARGRGIALQLKRYQRRWCLEHGIELIRWTFDPLRHTNAHLNVSRLGVTVSAYLADYYGAMKGINAGLASDRLLAEWDLNCPRVVALAQGNTDGSLKEAVNKPPIMIKIPADLNQLLACDKAGAVEVRMQVRNALTKHFAAGYSITDYDAARYEYHLTQIAR